MTNLWLNGEIFSAEMARLDPADRGFTLGDGLFETIAVRDGKILRLPAHLARLKQDCQILALPFPITDFAAAILAVLESNQLEDAVIRLTLTRGVAARGVLPPTNPSPTLMITAAPLPPTAASAFCIISSVTRRNEFSPLSRIKSTNYLDCILAKQEAAKHGADEAIMLNTTGKIAEASSANLFVLKDDVWLTPPLADGALAGIMRGEILAKLPNSREQSLWPDDLTKCRAAYLSSSLGLRPIRQIGDYLLDHTSLPIEFI